jgi:LacI family transcriptional regulator
MTTIKRVAEVAGVSFKTVSRVINEDPAVRAETRARVLDAVAQLGYRPNQIARQMRTQRSQFIGFITDEIATTPYAVNIVRGAQLEAWNEDRMLLVVNTDGDAEHEATAIRMLLERQVDSIIYATMRHRVIDPSPLLRSMQVVLVNCRASDQSLPSVVPDEVGAAQAATEILIRKGHRRAAFINLEAKAVAAVLRLEGYQRALAAHDIPFDAQLVRNTDGRPNMGYVQAVAVLSLPQPPTAIFCGNDQVAAGAYDAIRERGLRIPQDVAVVGFDNLELIATYLEPTLSTMALPHEAMGRWAVQHLRSLREADAPVHAVLECPYVERESV